MGSRLSNFNILEILDLAQKIEDNGEKFYREAAERYPDYAEFLVGMAEQEMGHKVFFQRIKKRLQSEDEAYIQDPDGIVKSNLDAIADGLIFDEFHCDNATIDKIMATAVEREEDTILFFQETLKLLNHQDDQRIVSRLIEEEKEHIAWIREKQDSFPQKHPLLR